MLKTCTEDEIGYLKMTLKAAIESHKRLAAFKEFLPPSLSCISLLVSCGSWLLGKEPEMNSMVALISMFIVFVLLCYWFLSDHPGKNINTDVSLLEMIQQHEKETSRKSSDC